MEFILTDQQRFVIIVCAIFFFLLSVLITCCIVLPSCWLAKLVNRSRNYIYKSKQDINNGKQRLVLGESKHFQLKVVPLYGSSNNNNDDKNCHYYDGNLSTSHVDKINCLKINKSDKLINNTLDSVAGPFNSRNVCVWLTIRVDLYGKENGDKQFDQPKSSGNSCDQYRLFVRVDRVSNLIARDYGVEPACYVTIDLVKIIGLRAKRYKSSSIKVLSSFRTDTAKRGLKAEYKQVFTSNYYPKNVIKDAKLIIKLMDDERYANDACLGETTISLKQFVANDLDCVNYVPLSTCYQLKQSKESKGMISITTCYLPTAKRITINVIKVNLTCHSNVSTGFYIRILMFYNGKLVRKKKTAISDKLLWTESDAITFDLEPGSPENNTFLLVLSSTNESSGNNLSSPSSPETPDIPTNGSRKDRHVGHAIIGIELWKEMKNSPRKKITREMRLV